MKNNRHLIFLGLVLICFIPVFFARAQDQQSFDDMSDVQTVVEHIDRMDIMATIHPDASVSVVETIAYDFADQYKHGIYRTIPLGFTAKGEPGHTQIKVDAVTDEKGVPYAYHITSKDPVNVKIGDADTEITGAHTYKISYTLTRSIGYFDGYDEWYWVDLDCS